MIKYRHEATPSSKKKIIINLKTNISISPKNILITVLLKIKNITAICRIKKYFEDSFFILKFFKMAVKMIQNLK